MLLAAWLWVCPSPLWFGFMFPESRPSVQTTSSLCGYHRASSSAGQLVFVTPGPAQGSPPLHSPIVSSSSPSLAQWPVCCCPGAWVRLSRNDPIHVFGSPTWNCQLLEGKGPFIGSLPLSLSDIQIEAPSKVFEWITEKTKILPETSFRNQRK